MGCHDPTASCVATFSLDSHCSMKKNSLFYYCNVTSNGSTASKGGDSIVESYFPVYKVEATFTSISPDNLRP